eukprot:SAG31_NODE_1709_length_7476_cov_25.181254_5_plen_108_part_00
MASRRCIATALALLVRADGADSSEPEPRHALVSCESLADVPLGANVRILSATRNNTAYAPRPGFRRLEEGEPVGSAYCLVKVLVAPVIPWPCPALEDDHLFLAAVIS